MDILRLEPIAEHGYSGRFLYNIFINGRDFINMVREVELPFARREGPFVKAGDYLGFNDYTLEHQIESFLTDGTRYILCESSWDDDECLFVRITTTETTVTWSNFFNNYHIDKNKENFWDHSALGPFIFDKEQYVAEFTREHRKLFWPSYHDPREDYPFLQTNRSGIAKDGTNDENKS
jgi:hypothetical protein